MLRAVASIYIESQALLRRDRFQIFRVCNYSNVTVNDKTVLGGDGTQTDRRAAPRAPPPAQRAPPPARPAPRAWPALAVLAAGAALGGMYLYRNHNSEDKDKPTSEPITSGAAGGSAALAAPVPALAAQLPAHAEFLLVGGGTAAFAAMRAIRSARPEAQVLIAADEVALPYMRPPLSKDLWREPDLAALAARLDRPDRLAFHQWNGRRRDLAYEPEAFYTPPERMRDALPGAALARGWRVVRLDPDARVATLQAGDERHDLTYGRLLLATGARARRVPALRAAAAAGLSLTLRDARDAARLARALVAPGVRRVAVVGGGPLAAELAAALAAQDAGRRVLLLCRDAAPLADTLPPYLAAEAARRLAAAGVELRAGADVVGAEVTDAGAGGVRLRLADGGEAAADLVVECVGAEPVAELAADARLELHAQLGGVLVNGELMARSGVWAAGDVACFYDEALGRRRVEHHDHAVLTGRLAGENMAGVAPPRTFRQQSMFWSELDAQLGFEAVGIVDPRLETVGVFADADAAADAVTTAPPGPADAAAAAPPGSAAPRELPRRLERGVVFYLREGRVVGVLLWNLYNRMRVARQVLARGEFDDLFETAKLFSLHEED